MLVSGDVSPKYPEQRGEDQSPRQVELKESELSIFN
jgi:hypothetical protein